MSATVKYSVGRGAPIAIIEVDRFEAECIAQAVEEVFPGDSAAAEWRSIADNLEERAKRKRR